MISCPQARELLALYIDGELLANDVLEMEAHLSDCDACRTEFNQLRSVVDAVRGSNSLYEAPQGSYESAARMVSAHTSPRWMPSLVAAAILAVMISVWAWMQHRERSSAFASYAAQMHLAYTDGKFPLDIQSGDSQQIAKWFEQRVPFHIPDHQTYGVSGARLMQYEGKDVAYFAYTMDRKPVSLMIAASSDRIVPSGSQIYQSGKLTFHFAEKDGLEVITWNDHGLTYAQVSDPRIKGAESCGICHGSAQERPKFENLQRQSNPLFF